MICKKKNHTESVEVEFEISLVISRPVLLSTVLITLVFLCIHFILPIHNLAKKKKKKESQEGEWDFEV